MRQRAFAIALAGLVLCHVVFGLARVPHSVIGKRYDDIHRYQSGGATRYFLDTEHHTGHAEVTWLQQHTTPDCVVLWSGDWKGALELAAPLLRPRLVVQAEAIASNAATHAGRRIARGTIDGADGRLVLIGAGRHLRIGVR